MGKEGEFCHACYLFLFLNSSYFMGYRKRKADIWNLDPWKQEIPNLEIINFQVNQPVSKVFFWDFFSPKLWGRFSLSMTCWHTSPKTNMTGWKIHHEWRCISYWTWGILQCHVSFLGGKPIFQGKNHQQVVLFRTTLFWESKSTINSMVCRAEKNIFAVPSLKLTVRPLKIDPWKRKIRFL